MCDVPPKGEARGTIPIIGEAKDRILGTHNLSERDSVDSETMSTFDERPRCVRRRRRTWLWTMGWSLSMSIWSDLATLTSIVWSPFSRSASCWWGCSVSRLSVKCCPMVSLDNLRFTFGMVTLSTRVMVSQSWLRSRTNLRFTTAKATAATTLPSSTPSTSIGSV